MFDSSGCGLDMSAEDLETYSIIAWNGIEMCHRDVCRVLAKIAIHKGEGSKHKGPLSGVGVSGVHPAVIS